MIIEAYKSLSEFKKAEGVIEQLAQTNNHELFTFPNGDPKAIESILEKAGIKHSFEQLISTSEVKKLQTRPYCIPVTGKESYGKNSKHILSII